MNEQINQIITEHKENQEKEQERKNKDTIQLANKTKLLHHIVRKNANPNPVIIAGIIILVLVLVKMIHMLFSHFDASGTWIDDNDNRWELNHKIIGGVEAEVNGNKVDCEIDGHMFKSGRIIGVWDYNNTILLISGGRLKRVQ